MRNSAYRKLACVRCGRTMQHVKHGEQNTTPGLCLRCARRWIGAEGGKERKA